MPGSMESVALVVFDMAGTTIEDAGQVPEAFTTVLLGHGIAITADELNALRGASKSTRSATSSPCKARPMPSGAPMRSSTPFASTFPDCSAQAA